MLRISVFFLCLHLFLPPLFLLGLILPGDLHLFSGIYNRYNSWVKIIMSLNNHGKIYERSEL
jgi:hypothetical protein